jgi:hypothetical protein
MATFVSFARRHNADSTIDSICARCYQTIAHERDEANLINPEQSHSCDPSGEYLWLHPEEQTVSI